MKVKMKRMKKGIIMSLLVVAGCSIFLTSCLKNNNNNQPVQPQAGLYVLHASPDAPDVFVYSDSAKLFSQSLSYYHSPGGYLAVDTSWHKIAFLNSSSGDTLAAGTYDFQDGKLYTAILYDSLDKAKIMRIDDNFSSFDQSKVNIRFLNLSPDAPAMDLYLDTTAVYTSRTFADNVENTSYNDVKTLNGGTYDITLKRHSDSTTLKTRASITLTPGYAYTIISAGFVNGTGDQAQQIGIITNNQ